MHNKTLKKEAAFLNKLIDHFKEFFPLNDLEAEQIAKHFEERRIKKRQFVLQAGDVCKHFTFVVTGCLKMYAIDKSGKEHNLEFIAENNWGTDLSSFYLEKPSQLYIDAVEPAIILQIKHDDLTRLYTNYHTIDHNFRVIIEQKYIELQNRVLQNISSSAEQRYDHFLKQYPNLSNRLPNTLIASYLGITPEFLSKIRKDKVSRL